MIFGMEGACWMGGFGLMLAVVGTVMGGIGLFFALISGVVWTIGNGVPMIVEKTMPPVHQFFSYGGTGRTISSWIGRILLTVMALLILTFAVYVAAKSYCHHGMNFGKAYSSAFDSDSKPGKGK